MMKCILTSVFPFATGLRGSYFDKSQVTRAVIDPYRRPKCVKGFEAGIVRFLRSRAAPSGFLGAFADALRAAAAAERPQSPLERLCAAGIPILIVHGEQDALVPLSNSRRLAGASRPHAACRARGGAPDAGRGLP